MSNGKILLVGFGPGAEAHMSVRALQAIEEADVVIGYSTYIKLVKNLLDGKEVIRKGMTEEIDRCIEAYEQAQLGKTVALVSSGDIGVYGMAGPTYEVLLKSGWKPGCGIEVEIVPGSTALSACASLVGAPLTHDFCSISLSDLLTPWPTIARRIDAAGRSDFVVALYNPKSGRRTQQIVEAQRILLQYRRPDTPVAVVKSAYREAQNIQMVRLDEMKDCKIGMLTTVLVGNSSTYFEQDLMITPRGYANKYKDITGDTIEGEQGGRSLSMGLVGWKGCVREYLRNNDQSLRDIVRHFDSPTGEIISAISEATEDDTAGEYSAALVQQNAFSVIEAAKHWGLLRAVVRCDAGAVSELMVHAEDFVMRRDWLNIENQHFHLHINWARVQQAWLIRRNDNLSGTKLCGVHFTDEKNETVFNLSLVRKEGIYNTEALKTFEQDWQDLIEINELEKASNE